MTMRYRTLGGTGIEVSVHCLGAMMFGAVGNPDHDDCARIIHHALDEGINFIDTADMYSAGESEEIVGKALRGRRDDVVLATKVHFQMGQGRNRNGNSRRWIVKEVEDSLRRLQTDWIDLYQVHRPDHTTDVEETLGALGDLVAQGKIRAFGCSTFPAEEIVEAHHVAGRRRLQRFRTEQPPYSLLDRHRFDPSIPENVTKPEASNGSRRWPRSSGARCRSWPWRSPRRTPPSRR
ncbi:aldo/keto reductase [Nonomuraea sp. SYSU D8015]|uniref:aldo/keto reductase n=1 Tax=Nonomuraea sp. SYSU D8015 TaxID=2593644 RepID=UPI001CB6EA3F|nr:aldo/keto reductase [Nonomuraea sp. SYSU D8015]